MSQPQVLGNEIKSQTRVSKQKSSLGESDGRINHGPPGSQYQHYQHQYSQDLNKPQYPTSSSTMTHGGSSKSLGPPSSGIPGPPNRGSVPTNVQQPNSASLSSSASSSMDNLSRLSQNELIQRVKKLETDLLKLASDHNHMIREANLRIQVQLRVARN